MDPVEMAATVVAVMIFGIAAVVSGRRTGEVGWWIWAWIVILSAGVLLQIGAQWTPALAAGAFLPVLFPGLQLAGAFQYTGRPVPRWLIPAFAVLASLRVGVAAAGFEAQSHLSVVGFELAALGAAAMLVRSRSREHPMPREWLLVSSFVALAVLELVDAVLDARGAANSVAWMVWLAIGVPVFTCQLLATFDRIQGRLAQSLADREEALRSLEESNERFRAIAEEADDVIVEVDAPRGIRYANPRFFEVLGYTPEQVLGHRLSDFAWDRADFPTRADFEGHRRRVFGPLRLRHHDGSFRWLECSSRAYRRDGEHHLVVIARDVTERLRTEEEHRKTQKLESLGLLAGGIAHDFNNLLTGILGTADLLLFELPEGHPARGLVKQLVDSSEQAAQLTRQLQAYSGASPFEIRPIDVSEEIRERAELLRRAAGDGVDLELELTEQLPLVEADPALLSQVVLNLVLNGAEACGGGPGTVRIVTGRTRVEPGALRPASGSLDVGDHVFAEVQDTGRGIDESIRDRLFDPFFTTNELRRGRGLGLAVVHGVVKTLRGAIEVQSTRGRGSCFRLLLPVAKRTERRSDIAQTGAREGTETVLVVDDDVTVLEVVRAALEKYGYKVWTASTGRRARQIVESETDVGLVLLDAVIPGEKSEDVLQDLRSLRPGLPVLLISGYAEADAMQSFAESGEVSSFLAKPFRSEELASRVRQVLDGSGPS